MKNFGFYYKRRFLVLLIALIIAGANFINAMQQEIHDLKKTTEPNTYLTSEEQSPWLEHFWQYHDTKNNKIIHWECACAELAWNLVREKYKTSQMFVNEIIEKISLQQKEGIIIVPGMPIAMFKNIVYAIIYAKLTPPNSLAKAILNHIENSINAVKK
jgi:hypothetical protein